MPTSNRIVGITLVVIGALILLGQIGVDFFGWLWPVLLCVIGAGLLWSWYTRSDDSGKVFSGVLLILLACFFLYMRRDSSHIEQHWPFFVLAPGLSLLAMARADRSRRDASVPGWIAIASALVLYFFSSGLFMGLMGFLFGLIGLVLRLLVPVALVGLGAWMLMNNRRREQVEKVPLPEKYEPAPAAPAQGDEREDEEDEEEEDEYTELDHSVGPIPAVRDDADEYSDEYADGAQDADDYADSGSDEEEAEWSETVDDDPNPDDPKPRP